MENKKKILNVVIDDDVKKLTIEGKNENQEVVMREELSDDDLDAITGGTDILTRMQECKSFAQEMGNSVDTEPLKAWWIF